MAILNGTASMATLNAWQVKNGTASTAAVNGNLKWHSLYGSLEGQVGMARNCDGSLEWQL